MMSPVLLKIDDAYFINLAREIPASNANCHKEFRLSRTRREKAQTQRTPRTQRGNKALFYGLFSFVTSPALQPTQCGASVVSFPGTARHCEASPKRSGVGGQVCGKKDFPVKNGRAKFHIRMIHLE